MFPYGPPPHRHTRVGNEEAGPVEAGPVEAGVEVEVAAVTVLLEVHVLVGIYCHGDFLPQRYWRYHRHYQPQAVQNKFHYTGNPVHDRSGNTR
jgi:hypothetical protein